MDRLESQLQFVSEAGRLKGVLRQTVLTDPPRRENSAEHSWHLAVMALALAEHAPPGTDIATVIAMLVLHDLVEVDAGDLSVYAADEAQARQAAAEAIPPGMEHADAHKLQLAPAEAAKLHVVSKAEVERRVKSGEFPTAVSCDDDDTSDLDDWGVYSQKADFDRCAVFWQFKKNTAKPQP
ncbi:MAG TPA: HD domain-containing protein [Terriglobales bacterium]